MQWNGDKKVYLLDKAASLNGGIGERAEKRIKFRPSVLESEDHASQAPAVDPGAGYAVEMDIFALTVRAATGQQAELACIPPAARAIIACGAEKKLIPAITAQILVCFANALKTIHADCRPKEVVQSTQSEDHCLFSD